MATTLRVPQTRWSARLTRECSSTESSHVYFTSTDTLGITEGWFDFDPTTSNAETFYLTGITGTPAEYTGTITYRGLRTYGVDTEVSGNKKSHRVSARVIISDDHNWLQQIITAFNTHEDLASSFHGFAGIGTTASRPSPASNANKLYASTDDLVVYFSNGTAWNSISAGTQPDASTTVKGVSKLSVAPVSSTAPIVVGDNDPRMISTGNVTDLTDGGESSLHYHNSDRARANHTGYQSTTTIRETAIAGETLGNGDFVFIKTSDGKLYKASKDITTNSESWDVCGVCTQNGIAGDTLAYQPLIGEYTYPSAHGFTIGAVLYLHTNGTLSTTAPVTNSASIVPMIIGRVLTSTKIQLHKQRKPRVLFVKTAVTSGANFTVTCGFPVASVRSDDMYYNPTSAATYFSTGYYDVLANTQYSVGGSALVYFYALSGTVIFTASINGSNNVVMTWSGSALPSGGGSVYYNMLTITEAI